LRHRFAIPGFLSVDRRGPVLAAPGAPVKEVDHRGPITAAEQGIDAREAVGLELGDPRGKGRAAEARIDALAQIVVT
jgi:hypothetical protein